MTEFLAQERQIASFTIAPGANATILPSAPPQESYEITEVVIANSSGATITGNLLQFATLQGFSQQGTTQGTIVEPFTIPPGQTFIDGTGEAMVTRVSSGNLLYGQVAGGTVNGRVTYRPRAQRG
jgi:hypothetical protein